MFDIIETSNQYGATNITPYPLVASKGEGVYLYDSNEKKYIDMVSGISVLNFGHHHPRLMNALISQATQIAIVPRVFHNKPLALLMKIACESCGMDQALPMNTGVEAVETAIKLARKWGYTVKQIPNNKADIITCDNSFHGRTIAAISSSSVSKYKENFGPLTSGFVSIPYNDVEALEKAINQNTAAFIVEPIQGEAGVIIPDAGYLKKCETICKKNNVLFIVDEIQTGMGRTGKLLGLQHEDISPDGILLGKALGGGLLPISLFLAKKHLMEVIQPGEHGSTFGGNPLASFVAYEAIITLLEENLSQNAAILGDYFIKKLKEIKSSAIIEVRGVGLLIAIEIDTNKFQSNHICEKLIEAGLLGLNTRNKIIRLMPPLVITKQQIDDAIEIIQHVFNNL